MVGQAAATYAKLTKCRVFWFSARVELGRTDLHVVPLGLASSYGIMGKEVERAFERGLNLFYRGCATHSRVRSSTPAHRRP